MQIGNFEILLSSLPSKEKLVAEIYYKNFYWAQITQETKDLIIYFYPHPTHPYWEFSLDKALKVLAEAKKKLIGKSRT